MQRKCEPHLKRWHPRVASLYREGYRVYDIAECTGLSEEDILSLLMWKPYTPDKMQLAGCIDTDRIAYTYMKAK